MRSTAGGYVLGHHHVVTNWQNVLMLSYVHPVPHSSSLRYITRRRAHMGVPKDINHMVRASLLVIAQPWSCPNDHQ